MVDFCTGSSGDSRVAGVCGGERSASCVGLCVLWGVGRGEGAVAVDGAGAAVFGDGSGCVECLGEMGDGRASLAVYSVGRVVGNI